jgi:hypothetical protein
MRNEVDFMARRAGRERRPDSLLGQRLDVVAGGLVADVEYAITFFRLRLLEFAHRPVAADQAVQQDYVLVKRGHRYSKG